MRKGEISTRTSCGSSTGRRKWYEEEHDVDAISSNTQCYNCGKYGHVAKGCPAKGKGKGGYGVKGKGKGGPSGPPGGWSKGGNKGWTAKGGEAKGGKKGGEKGWGKGGWGQGYQGQCYRCGQIGHKAWECGSVEVGEIQQQQEP